MISVNSVSRFYGDVCAVNNISFSIRRGEITGLLGPNGAGKTTTLRMLTCYLRPSSGTITVGDRLVSEDPIAVKRMIGYLPETAPLYGDMLVHDYLNYVGMMHGMPRNGRIREIAGTCGIYEVMHMPMGELSKGYRQRVGLAHAMIHDPEILILDEPTSGLDPNQIIEIRNLIKEIGRKKTVILSTHILSEVEATCERVIIIDRGRIVTDSRTEDLKASFGKEARVDIKVRGTDFAALSAAVRGINGVRDVVETKDEEDFASATVAAAGGVDVRPELFRLVNEKGWVLYEMSRKHTTLEHVFRELTGGGEHES